MLALVTRAPSSKEGKDSEGSWTVGKIPCLDFMPLCLRLLLAFIAVELMADYGVVVIGQSVGHQMVTGGPTGITGQS